MIAWAACGACIGLGAALLARHPAVARQIRATTATAARWARRAGWRALAAIAAGALAAAWTSIPVAGVAVGVIVALVPWLLTAPPARDVDMLEALDRWIRAMSAVLETGQSVGDAVRTTAASAPALLAPALIRLRDDLEERTPLIRALGDFGDDLAHPDADAVVAALILATQRGGTGTAVTLAALADSLQERLRAQREIETERAKPRIVVRQVTLITLVMLAGAFVVGREFFTPYASPLGQLILAGLLAIYLGALVVLRRMTTQRTRARILVAAS